MDMLKKILKVLVPAALSFVFVMHVGGIVPAVGLEVLALITCYLLVLRKNGSFWEVLLNYVAWVFALMALYVLMGVYAAMPLLAGLVS